MTTNCEFCNGFGSNNCACYEGFASEYEYNNFDPYAEYLASDEYKMLNSDNYDIVLTNEECNAYVVKGTTNLVAIICKDCKKTIPSNWLSRTLTQEPFSIKTFCPECGDCLQHEIKTTKTK